MTSALGSQQDPAWRVGGDEKSREVRLGLVMYGGVSLAIYINGVTQEFFRAVHGRGIYRLIKALTDSDIVVDVISGTSAGGINGIFLSYALCNGKNFCDASNLWRKYGDINKLLREPDGEIPNASSFLDSEGYYQPRLEEMFHDMREYVPETDEDSSSFNELDLFITSTDVDGRVYTQLDDAGHAIDVKDHRTVFYLKHRKGRKEPFNPKPRYLKNPDPKTTHVALAKLSRATSCFPAAFAPVHVAHVAPGDDSADAKLQLWGVMGKETCFLDGGVLDNKPFTYTIKAIFSRTADREVDRKLFYIEPDPEVLQQAERATNPNFVQAVLAALIGIPGYESIAEDLKLLAERNSKLRQYQRLVKQFQPDSAGTGLPGLYVRSRMVFLSERVIEGIFRQDSNTPLRSEDRKRATELARQFDDLSVDPAPLFRDFDVPFRMRRAYRIIYLIYDLLYGEDAGLKAEEAEVCRFLWRALNRQVKLYEILRSAMEALVDEAPIPWQEMEPREIWGLVETIYYRLLSEKAAPALCIREEDLTAFESGERKEWLTQEELQSLNEALGKLADEIVEDVRRGGRAADDSGEERSSMLQRLDGYEERLVKRCVPDASHPIRKAFEEFELLDAHLFPLEMVGNLHEKDIIETIRISPRDAERGFSQSRLSAKVSGDAVFHFGGFFKRSWRSNDILWGRLDGICQLVETLLDRERIMALVASDRWRAGLRGRFFAADGSRNHALDPEKLFPRAGEQTQRAIREWLDQVLSDDAEVRKLAFDEKTFDSMTSLLVEAEQLEALREDMTNVITDAIEEQADWNRFQVQADQERKTRKRKPRKAGAMDGSAEDIAVAPWIFQPSGNWLDPCVATAGAATRMIDAMDSLNAAGGSPARPAETRLGTFFKQSYRVGSEELTRDIPVLVLLEILAKALLVARTCIVGLFGDNAGRIRGNALYRVCIDLPLRAFYSLVKLSLRAPRAGLGVFLGTGALSLFALAVGLFFLKPLIWTHATGLSGVALGVFIIAPVVILLLQMIFLVWGGRWLISKAGVWIFMALLVTTALILGLLWPYRSWNEGEAAGAAAVQPMPATYPHPPVTRRSA
ncbi:MAG: patatin-like protein [Acidobacteria bacterium]|nr:patatin-like protein [Acidobacteriota bacterium]